MAKKAVKHSAEAIGMAVDKLDYAHDSLHELLHTRRRLYTHARRIGCRRHALHTNSLP